MCLPHFSTTSPSCPLSRDREFFLSLSSLWFAQYEEKINQEENKGRGSTVPSLMGKAIIMRQGPSLPPFPRWGHRGPAGSARHIQVCPCTKVELTPLIQDPPLALCGSPGLGKSRWTEIKWVLGPARHPHSYPTPKSYPSLPLPNYDPLPLSWAVWPYQPLQMLDQEQVSPAWPVPFSARDNSH